MHRACLSRLLEPFGGHKQRSATRKSPHAHFPPSLAFFPSPIPPPPIIGIRAQGPHVLYPSSLGAATRTRRLLRQPPADPARGARAPVLPTPGPPRPRHGAAGGSREQRGGGRAADAPAALPGAGPGGGAGGEACEEQGTLPALHCTAARYLYKYERPRPFLSHRMSGRGLGVGDAFMHETLLPCGHSSYSLPAPSPPFYTICTALHPHSPG